MAYSGTGTEADPYLVSTLTDLVALMADGVYIKIISDIDASQEEAFRDPVTSYVQFKGHVYADELKTISNVIVEYNTAIDFSGSIQSFSDIRNLFFKNWIHRKTGSGFSILGGYSNVKNCLFSIEMVDDSNGYSLLGKPSPYGNPGSFSNCAFYTKFTSGTSGIPSSTTMLQNVNVDKCTFVTENLMCTNLTVAGSSVKIEDCAFIGEAKLSPQSSGTMQMFIDDSTYTKTKIIWAVNMSLTESSREYPITLVFGNYVKYLMVDADILGENISTGFSNSTCRALTTEQMKSEQYLTDIGFLP